MKTTIFILISCVCLVYFEISNAQEIKQDTTTAISNLEKGEELFKKQEFDSAFVYYRKASLIYESHKLWENFLNCEVRVSECYSSKNNYDKAIKNTKVAIVKSLDHINEENINISKAYSSLGIYYYYREILDSTLFCFQKSLRIKKKLLGDKHIEIADLYNNLGTINDKKGDYDVSLNYYKNALDLYIELLGNSNPRVAGSYNNIGNTYDNKGEYNLAIEYHQKALKIKLELVGENHPSTADSYNNIGVSYKNKGEYDLAIEYYLKSLDIKKQVINENHPSIAESYNNIGNAYNNKKDYDMAIKYHKKALDIRTALYGKEHPYIALSYNNIGTSYADMEEYETALKYFNDAHKLFIRFLGEKHPLVARTYNNIGSTYYYMKQTGLSLKYFNTALAIKKEIFGKKHPTTALTYIMIGNAYFDLHKYDLALKAFQKGLVANLKDFNDSLNIYNNPVVKNYLHADYLLQTLQLKADVLISIYKNSKNDPDKLNNLNTALEIYQICDTLIYQMRKSTNTKTDKIALGATANTIYTLAIEACLLTSNVDTKNKESLNHKAFYFSEKNKSSVLLDALEGAEAQKFAGIPDSLLNIEQKLSTDIALYKQQLAEVTDSISEVKYRNKLFKLNRKYDSLISFFEDKYPKYFELKYNRKPISRYRIKVS